MKIRIAYFAPLLATGGTQRHLQQVLHLLDPSRFETRVLTLRPGGEVEDELRATGIEVQSLSLGARLTSPRSLRAIVAAARELRRARIDVVHGYQWRPALVGSIVGRIAGVRLVLASKRSLTGSDRAARVAWRRIAWLADTIVVNAEALRAEGELLGMQTSWVLHQNGVDSERFDVGPTDAAAKTALGLDPARPVVGAIGRLEGRKGQDQLLTAAATLVAGANGRAPQVIIVGDGPTRDALESQARELGLAGNVRFLGGLADVRPALRAMDIFVLPSREEGMSNAILEAMAAARPVVATDVGGNGEILADGRTGVLVPGGDCDAMAAAILGLLGDAERAQKLGSAARREVTARFGARASVARLERLYEERLGTNGRRAA
jgi:glycosyltransferase involved in cell wall biosynthesis